MTVSSAPPLRSGPENPVPSTPPRQPASVRRTTTLDMTRSEGLFGPVVADVRGQDVLTDSDGAARVLDALHLELRIDASTGTVSDVRVVETGTPPPVLVGAAVGGLGRRLAEEHPDEQARRPLLYSVLEDLGGALLVSGYAPLHAGTLGMSREDGAARAEVQADICAGWATGSPLLENLRLEGVAGLPIGPPAPVIDADDPLGWHTTAPMEHPTVRRRRRLDVAPAVPGATGHEGASAGDGALAVQSHFRDSFAAPEGEQVMHEYLLDATVDSDGVLAAISVEPRVLPWYECPAATASAERVVGTPLCDVPARVRRDLVGPSTCTHLNSTLRCLADANRLASDVPTRQTTD